MTVSAAAQETENPPSPEATSTSPSTESPPEDLIVWLAPKFSLDTDSPAGLMLSNRLTAFQEAHPGIDLSVRFKAAEGPANLFDSLTAAQQAAPGAMPDVIVLNPTDLNAAALKGLIVTLDGLLEPPREPEWYGYALEAAHVDGQFFGLPFASEADILAYRTGIYPNPPASWDDLIENGATFLFPAGDPLASFSLSQYLALQGPLEDEQGRPMLDENTLTQVLEFYDQAYTDSVLPFTSLQYAQADETWLALSQNRAAAAVAPFGLFLDEHDSGNEAAVPLPTRDGAGISLMQAWSWALVTPDPLRQALAIELIEWLSEPEFLGPWSRELGLLPTNAEALATWPDDSPTAMANRLVSSARARPSEETFATLGPPLAEALRAVIERGISPLTAARLAAESLEPDED
jgi:ABC-type glycerol-3-phosphate transport system substrate-binding protein